MNFLPGTRLRKIQMKSPHKIEFLLETVASSSRKSNWKWRLANISFHSTSRIQIAFWVFTLFFAFYDGVDVIPSTFHVLWCIFMSHLYTVENMKQILYKFHSMNVWAKTGSNKSIYWSRESQTNAKHCVKVGKYRKEIYNNIQACVVSVVSNIWMILCSRKISRQ